MQKQILLVIIKQKFEKPRDRRFADMIADSITSLGGKCIGIVGWDQVEEFLEKNNCTPQNTLLHYRSAGAKVITPKAYEFEKRGYQIINSPKVLDRTGDKFKSCEWALQNGIKLPVTVRIKGSEVKEYIKKHNLSRFVLKPINSVGQGIYCFQSSSEDPDLDEKISKVPGDEIILQEFVDYIRIFRVIIIGDKILDKAVFYDEPTVDRWKVSVCLNPEIKHKQNPDPKLLDYAKQLADVFESEIAFIDVFETKDGYVLSEINTACNLKQHEEMSGYPISRDIAQYLISKATIVE